MKDFGENDTPRCTTLHRCFVVIAVALFITVNAHAQQNLFNIPSGDITPKNKFFYQHQLNFYQSRFDSKVHVVYGVGKNIDVGFNFISKYNSLTKPFREFGFNDNRANGALHPACVLTFQKMFPIKKDKLNFHIGTQAGINLSSKHANVHLANYTYSYLTYFFNSHIRVIGGMYYANTAFSGRGNVMMPLMGFEAKLYKNWYAMGDWQIGNNDTGEGVIGGMYALSKRVQLCGGVLLPNHMNYSGFVFEFNWLGWDYTD